MEKNDLCIFPIRESDLWEFYKKAVSAFWVPEEIALYEDVAQWRKLSDDEKTFIKHVLGFFAQSDGIVNLNLTEMFLQEIPYKEAKFFYGFQIAIENIHNETYALLIDTFIHRDSEKKELFNAIDSYPCIVEKANWAIKYINNKDTLAHRLFAFIIVEGLFFSSSFASLFWLKERGILKGLTFSNELISRDEALHVEFGIYIYNKMVNENKIERLTLREAHQIMAIAVQIEKRFVRDSLKVDLIGMNASLMYAHVEFMADRLLSMLGYEKRYNQAKTPFHFMENISMQGKTNFFERKNSEYMIPMDDKHELTFDFDEDF